MVKENLLKVHQRILEVCSKINRDPRQITIVAISKGRTTDQIIEAINAGITDIGENRVKEATVKYNLLKVTPYIQKIKWHMVGHLQTNKVKEAVRIFDLIHSVDSLHLAQEIDKQAARINKIQDILFEVKTSSEETKFGLKPNEITELLREASKLKNISIKGLMTIAPLVYNPEQARPYFRMLREIRDDINLMRISNCDLSVLSMGMTNDFEIAIEEGATMIRLGRAIFGE
ncbi:MAG: YggS family pyridoxal phosphate-dependent enzyme [Candidatus Omnitrophica bacterium]|nr:YggS family pyridoxal phosphate-dependent enzyme [Candidatus Omnitrophota bacterium]